MSTGVFLFSMLSVHFNILYGHFLCKMSDSRSGADFKPFFRKIPVFLSDRTVSDSEYQNICRLFIAVHFCFKVNQFVKFFFAPKLPFPGPGVCFQPGSRHFSSHFVADNESAHTEYVGVVYYFGSSCLVYAFAKCCIDTSVFVADNAYTHSCTADGDSSFVFFALNASCNCFGCILEKYRVSGSISVTSYPLFNRSSLMAFFSSNPAGSAPMIFFHCDSSLICMI